MPHYFLHVRDGTSEILDPEGSRIDSMDELRDIVMHSARELLLCGIPRGVLDLRCRIDAQDEAGRIVYSLPFRHAVSIIWEDDGAEAATAPQPAHRSAATAQCVRAHG